MCFRPPSFFVCCEKGSLSKHARSTYRPRNRLTREGPCRLPLPAKIFCGGLLSGWVVFPLDVWHYIFVVVGGKGGPCFVAASSCAPAAAVFFLCTRWLFSTRPVLSTLLAAFFCAWLIYLFFLCLVNLSIRRMGVGCGASSRCSLELIDAFVILFSK